MYWFWGVHMFWWIFWFVLLMTVIFAWARPRTVIRVDPAIEVLREKYAAGEVTDDEYLHRLAVLTGRAQPTTQPKPSAPAPRPQPAAA